MTEKIKTIITVLNKYMMKTGQTRIGAVEAAEYLDKLGYLPLGKRNGKALRDMLRDGKIPNAIQPGGKNHAWYILYSGDEIEKSYVSPSKPKEMSKKTSDANTKINNISYGLAPVEEQTAECLILGTLPGKYSLREQHYYANAGNRFWRIMSNILNESELEDAAYDKKTAILKKYNIALWDVLKAAEREGSLDANLKNVIVNDIIGFLNTHKSISVIGLNGKQAQILFHKYIGTESIPSDVKIINLRSTSPANAQFSLEDMIQNWKHLFE